LALGLFSWFPGLERQFFGPFGLRMLTLIVCVFAIAVGVRAVNVKPHEFAILLVGFVFDALMLLPPLLYGAVGDPPVPRPHAQLFVNLTGYAILAMVLWTLVMAFLLRRNGWLSALGLIFGIVQTWMAIILAFLTAGVVANSWL
jgi:hypothetical protein